MGILVSPLAQLAASLGQRRLRLLGVFCLHHMSDMGELCLLERQVAKHPI